MTAEDINCHHLVTVMTLPVCHGLDVMSWS